jgi:hypothetical protein
MLDKTALISDSQDFFERRLPVRILITLKCGANHLIVVWYVCPIRCFMTFRGIGHIDVLYFPVASGKFWKARYQIDLLLGSRAKPYRDAAWLP